MPRHTFDLADSENGLTFDRMEGENHKSFEYFRLYRNLGPHRTLEKVVALLDGRLGSRRSLQAMSIKYKWVERAGLFDSYLDRQQMKEAEKTLPEWERLRQQSLMDNIALASSMRQRLREMLAWPIAREIERDHFGRIVKVIMPSKWTFATIVHLAKVTAELEAATIAEAIAGAIDADFDVDAASVEQLREYVQRGQEARKGKKL